MYGTYLGGLRQDDLQVEASRPYQAHQAIDIPPKPGELLLLTTMMSLMAGGVHYDTLSDLSNPYVTIVSTWGRHATLMSEAVVQPPLPLPVAIVNKYPSNFNYNDTPSDDGVKDKTILADDIVPVDRGGVPALPTDPISDEAFHKGLAAIRARCNAMMATIKASNQITYQHHNALLTHRERLDQADAAHASI